MSRLSPRIYQTVEASITANGQQHLTQLKNLGLEGAYLAFTDGLSLHPITPGTIHGIGLSCGDMGELTVTGEPVWRDSLGYGLRFSGMSRANLLSLWGYTSKFLTHQKSCPYCGRVLDTPNRSCGSCGWNLNFQEEDYFTYWKRESLVRRLSRNLRDLSTDQLQKMSNYLQTDILFKKEESCVEEIEGFVGSCEKIRYVFSLIRKVAPTDLPVLLLGESGTGKELTARLLHERSPRRNKAFVAIDCAAMPASLIEAELFGYERGAFTGAYQAKKGKFECADQGTLFLDEIGEIPNSLQPKLLRFLESQTIERIGSIRSREVDVRIIAATNRDLEAASATGHFRSDLYHRIKVFTIHLPPLRDREKDKVILARYFLKKIKQEGQGNCRGFTPAALDAIRKHFWPGNVREMINRIRRAVVVQDEWIRPEDLELDPHQRTERRPHFREATVQLKKELILSALGEHQYNISQSARSLGISRPYLYTLIKKLGLHVSR